MPGVVSDVSATLVPSHAQRPQSSSATADGDTTPFTALLDTSATAPPATAPQASLPQASSQASASADGAPVEAADPNNNPGSASAAPNSAASASPATTARGGPRQRANMADGGTAQPADAVPAAPGNAASGARTVAAAVAALAAAAAVGTTLNGGDRSVAAASAKSDKNASASDASTKAAVKATSGGTMPPAAAGGGSMPAPAPALADEQTTVTAAGTANGQTAQANPATGDDAARAAANTVQTPALPGIVQQGQATQQNPPVRLTASIGQIHRPASPPKTSTGGDQAEAANDSGGANGASPTATDPAQIPAAQTQPVTAAIVLNTQTDAASRAAPTSTSVLGIGSGAPTSPRARLLLPAGTAENGAAPQNSADAGAAQQAPAPTTGDEPPGADPASASGRNLKAQAANANATATPSQAGGDSAAATQTANAASATTDRTTAPPAQPSAITSNGGTANVLTAPNGTGASKPDLAGLPDFGLSSEPAAAPSLSQAAPAAPATVAPPVAVPIAGLPVAIAARALAGSNQFEIRLVPPELGRIDVQLNVDGNGQVSSHMTVERADTLQLLQSQQPQLQHALEQAGLKTADNGLQFTLRDQSFGSQNNGAGTHAPPQQQLVIPDPDLPPIAATQIYNRAGLGGGVDIRV